MTQARALIIAIFLPLQPVLRMWRAVLYFLEKLEAMLGNEDIRKDLSDTPRGRAKLQRGIAFGEDGINFLIALCTRELLGLPLIITSQRCAVRRPQSPGLSRS